jgi:hypothetical protein
MLPPLYNFALFVSFNEILQDWSDQLTSRSDSRVYRAGFPTHIRKQILISRRPTHQHFKSSDLIYEIVAKMLENLCIFIINYKDGLFHHLLLTEAPAYY